MQSKVFDVLSLLIDLLTTVVDKNLDSQNWKIRKIFNNIIGFKDGSKLRNWLWKITGICSANKKVSASDGEQLKFYTISTLFIAPMYTVLSYINFNCSPSEAVIF